jgi:hypothetical protein
MKLSYGNRKIASLNSMSKLKYRLAVIALVPVISLLSNIQVGKIDASPTNKESSAELDRRKSQEVYDLERFHSPSFLTPEEKNAGRLAWERFINDWEKVVDAAGLHTLLTSQCSCRRC